MSLSNIQKQLASGMIFPSGEANFYDFAQDHSYHKGSGINRNLSYIDKSGELYETYKVNESGLAERSGIFSFNKLISTFSNSSGTVIPDDIYLDNPYVHYYPDSKNKTNFKKNSPFYIPYISSYKVSIVYDPYKRIF